MGELTHKGSRDNLLGKKPFQEMIMLTSVEKQITEGYPPTYVWCGSADMLVAPDNSRMFAHGHELDFQTKESSWDKFRRICETVASHDDIVCCSTGEAFMWHNAKCAD